MTPTTFKHKGGKICACSWLLKKETAKEFGGGDRQMGVLANGVVQNPVSIQFGLTRGLVRSRSIYLFRAPCLAHHTHLPSCSLLEHIETS